jgi:hypothetical protein
MDNKQEVDVMDEQNAAIENEQDVEMEDEQEAVMDRRVSTMTIQSVILLSIAISVPLFHQQMITGPVVNATLFAATVLLGAQMGVLVGLIPSVIALSVGTLPAALAPMVPYIMLSNVILIVTFNFLKGKNYWLAITAASFLKFLFLFVSSSVVVGLLLKKELAESVVVMMSYPQLLTALLGGVLAKVFLDLYQGKK